MYDNNILLCLSNNIHLFISSIIQHFLLYLQLILLNTTIYYIITFKVLIMKKIIIKII
jgi:hypothetical protein